MIAALFKSIKWLRSTPKQMLPNTCSAANAESVVDRYPVCWLTSHWGTGSGPSDVRNFFNKEFQILVTQLF